MKFLSLFLTLSLSFCSLHPVYGAPPIIWGGGTDTSKLLTTYLVDKNGNPIPTAMSNANQMDLATFWGSDFINGSGFLGLATNSAGTGSGSQVSTVGINSTENAIGVVETSTGTTTTGLANFIGTQNQLSPMSHAFDGNWRIALSALSDATNTYTAYVGFIDNIGAGDHTDGAYFRYTHGTNGGEWECVTANAGARTARDSNVAADTLFSVFRITINQAGTSYNFYINGTAVCSSPVTSGNLPADATDFGWGVKIEKSAGTTARLIYSDYFGLSIVRSSAR